MTDKKPYILGFSFISALFLVFQLSYFNRFLPIQDGWFIEYAKQMNDGKLIYKDFHVFIQPIYVYIFKWVSDISDHIIAFRYYGLGERALLIGVAYLLFAEITTAYRAMFLVLVGMFLFVTNTADVIYSYYQLVAILVGLSTYFLIIFYRKGGFASIFTAGIFCGLSFMAKQSTGTLLPVALLMGMGTLNFAGIKPPVKTPLPALSFLAGFALPIILILGYLWQLGVLDYYWTEVFGGASSKGNISHVLFGFLGHMLDLRQFLMVCVLAALFCGLYALGHIRILPTAQFTLFYEKTKRYWLALGIILLSLVSIAPWLGNVPHLFAFLDSIYTGAQFFLRENRLAYACFYFNAALVLYYFCRALFKALRPDEVPGAIIAVASFAFMWGHGLSGFIEPHATFISAGLLFGWLLATPVPFNLIKNAAVYAAMLFIICMCSYGKGSWMYSWWGWDERPSWTATHKPETPLLKGFRLNEEDEKTIDGITKAIMQNSTADDSLYTFPHMPMFYLLANRHHDTFSAVHYFDVCPDGLARSDAKIVERTRPKVIVDMIFPDSVWTFHEDTFRGGARSGQRDIKELIERFKSSGDYKVVQTYITAGYGYTVEVLVRMRNP